MTGFTVTPETLSAAATRMRGIAKQLGPAWAPIAAQTESIQFGRGDDLVSPLIQVSLQGALALVNSCIETSAQSLGDYAAGLESMAETFGSIEQSNKGMFKTS